MYCPYACAIMSRLIMPVLMLVLCLYLMNRTLNHYVEWFCFNIHTYTLGEAWLRVNVIIDEFNISGYGVAR